MKNNQITRVKFLTCDITVKKFKCQSYEIRIRKAGGFPGEKAGIYKSIIYVGFQERRLQYAEKELMKDWEAQRYGEKILDLDLPLSYGVLEANNSPLNINRCEFLWDSCRDVGVFIKINCISTEFTQKKHGGEKGVPFRILIETFNHDESFEKIHAASCQVKVFKPKGADRKHKTDREKMCKRLQVDKEKYHPQYEYTVFRDLNLSDCWTTAQCSISSYSSATASPSPSSPLSSPCSQTSSIESLLDSQKTESIEGTPATSTTEITETVEEIPKKEMLLTHQSTIEETTSWLQKNTFGAYLKHFVHFTGSDLLNLSRIDMMDICGTANGIRLYNTIHEKSAFTIYVRLPTQIAGNAVYLRNPKVSELSSKIKALYGLPSENNWKFYVSGPFGMPIVITDEVVFNMLDNSSFIVEYMNASQHKEPYGVLLKQINKCSKENLFEKLPALLKHLIQQELKTINSSQF